MSAEMNEDLLWEYAREISSPEPDVLKKINRETHLYVMNPRMLSGHIMGFFLKMMGYMIKPERILEIGTYTGYSAICLAETLEPGGELITLERNAELEDIARRNIAEAGFDDKIKIIMGEALEIIPNLKGDFDMIFMDADKRDYPALYELVIPKLKPGGFIIADNVLWGGKVTGRIKSSDKDALGIKLFNEMVSKDPGTENLLLPLRDGIMIIRKKKSS